MSKYHLVASYYNILNNSFEEEIIITIPNIRLSTLIEIDKFTSSHTKSEILTIITKNLKIKPNLNHLAIRYTTPKKTSPIYYKIIDYNIPFYECITTISNNQINPNSPLFKKEKEHLLEILKTKNLEEFKQKFPYQTTFSFFVENRFLTAAFDNEYEEIKTLEFILKEFSKYETFRLWVLASQKKKQKKINQPNSPSLPKTNKNPSPKTIPQYELEYEEYFKKKHSITYLEYLTNIHNTSTQKEEFLTKEEYSSSYQQSSDTTPIFTPSKSRVKKKNKIF